MLEGFHGTLGVRRSVKREIGGGVGREMWGDHAPGALGSIIALSFAFSALSCRGEIGGSSGERRLEKA